MTKESILRILKQEKPELEREFSIKHVGLFGSFVSKTNTSDSDIDIVYEMKKGHYLGLEQKIKLEKRLRSKFKRAVDLVRLRYMDPAIRVKAEPQIEYV